MSASDPPGDAGLFEPPPSAQAGDGDDGGLARIEGVVERIVYENEANGFFVARLQESGKPDLTTIVGHLLAVSPGETVRVWGHWENDPKFGPQLRIARYQTILPATVKGIEKYLGSGLIEGIGPVYAKRLVDTFGVETFRVIEEAPQRLKSVPGVGKKRAEQIRKAWERQKAVQSIMVFLQGHGIGVNQAVRIYKRYGDGAVALLRDNPYRLAQDISGIAFKTADRIARELGVPADSPKRGQAGLLHVLQEAASEGHVFLPKPGLFERTAELLNADAPSGENAAIGPAALDAPLESLAAAGQAVCEESADATCAAAVYIKALYDAETACARDIKHLLRCPGPPVSIKTDKAIEWVERRHSIALSPQQRQAIETAALAKVMVVTGGPGTGKTTVVNSLLAIFEAKGLNILLCAPTGRAAKRLEETTNREARTLHRLLEFSPKFGQFMRNADNPVAADVVIVDETSMVDVSLMAGLLAALPREARLFLVGDVDQLPSVGPGHVLFDVIAGNTVPVVWLQTVFRQAAESGIINNAHRINEGVYPEFNAKDFFFVERTAPAKALETVVELAARRMPARFGLDPIRDIQVLTPMRRGEGGVARINEALQEALNPDGEPVTRKGFRVGDKVMQTRNNYERDAYNGDVGVIELVDTEVQEVQVDFGGRKVLYPFDELEDLALAYAATVHKSQGSEYRAVVLPLLSQHYMLLQRNVIYTAITRAREYAVIVGDPKAVRMAVSNSRVTKRHTRLAERLRGKT